MYPESLPKRGWKLVPNSVLQCYFIHIPDYWGQTCSKHSLIACNQWDQYVQELMMQDGYLKYYRSCWSAKNTLNVIKKTSVFSTVLCHLCFNNAYLHSQAGFLKTKQQLSSWIVASGYREHVMTLILHMMKSHPKCQIDIGCVCSQTFSHISNLIEDKGEYCLLLYIL